ncbi:MAG: barstar family protein [Chloroflexi bacterium]|nr:barstar family protein [Chloroflexota bacterium]
MEKIKSILSNKSAAGLYLLTSPVTAGALHTLAEEQKFSFSHLHGEAVATEDAFMDEIQQAANFPDYFGRMDESIIDCIQDLDHWYPRKKGYVFLYDDFHNLAKGAPETFEMVIECFQEGLHFWQERGQKPFYIFMRGDSAFLPTIPTI